MLIVTRTSIIISVSVSASNNCYGNNCSKYNVESGHTFLHENKD